MAEGFQSRRHHGSENKVDAICDPCKQSRNKKYKPTHFCKQCDEYYCENCTSVHKGLKATQDHVLTQLEEQEEENGSESESSTCIKHQREIEFVCIECDELICLRCKVESHDTHKSKEITVRAEEVRKEISDLLKNELLQHRKQKLEDRVKNLNRRSGALKQNLSEEIESVKKQEQKIKLKVTQAVEKKEQQLKKLYDSCIADTQSNLKQAEREYQNIRNAHTALKLGDNIDTIKQGRFVIDQLKDAIEKETEEKVVDDIAITEVYKKGSVDENRLETMVGKIDEFSLQRRSVYSEKDAFQHTAQRQSTTRRLTGDQRPTSMSLTTKIKLTLAFPVSPARKGKGRPIKGIAPISNNRAWISLENWNKIYLIEQDGTVTIKVDLGVVCDDVTANSKEECIVSCPEDKSLRLVTLNGQVNEVARLDKHPNDQKLDIYPRGLANRVFADGKEEILLTCAVKPTKTSYRIFGGKREMGMVMTVKSGQHPTQEKDLVFDYPIRICIGETGDYIYCVADYGTNEISIYDTANGQSEMYPGKPTQFSPYGICTSREGYTFICNAASDKRNSGLYVIFPDNTKKEIEQVLIEQNRIAYAVAVDADNLLWVGFSDGQIETYNIS